MTQAAPKRRLTIAVFDSVQRAWPAPAALLDAGLGGRQISLAAMSEALQQLAGNYQVAARFNPGLAIVLQNLRQSTPAGTQPSIAATPGELLTCLGRRSDGSHRTPADGRSWFSEHLRRSLETYILGGSVIVGVACDQVEQQWTSVRILLGQGTDEVRTFEFTPIDGDD